MKTKFQNQEEALSERKWILIDGNDKVVGRLATEIASILRGKNNPKFVPHHDCGDFVVVINCDKIRFTGDKASKKVYHKHTGFVGSVKSVVAEKIMAKKPEDILSMAVGGMLPKTPLGRTQLKKLKIYRGAEHPHAAQLAANL